jgi:hypothetical protein
MLKFDRVGRYLLTLMQFATFGRPVSFSVIAISTQHASNWVPQIRQEEFQYKFVPVTCIRSFGYCLITQMVYGQQNYPLFAALWARRKSARHA